MRAALKTAFVFAHVCIYVNSTVIHIHTHMCTLACMCTICVHCVWRQGSWPLFMQYFLVYKNHGVLSPPFSSHNTGTTHWLDPRLARYLKHSMLECTENGINAHTQSVVYTQVCAKTHTHIHTSVHTFTALSVCTCM